MFVAPSLIFHYVDAHKYQPPEVFIQAVGIVGVETKVEADLLSDVILLVARDPVGKNRAAFYTAFVSSRVGARVPAGTAPVSPGDCLTTKGCGSHIPVATAPSGEPLLLVLADVARLANRELGSQFFELEAVDVIKLAVDQNAGIIVQSSLPGREAWVEIPAADVRRLMLEEAQGRHI